MRPRPSGRLPPAFLLGVVLLAAADHACASDRLKPREIAVDRVNVAPQLVEATRDSQIERGKPRPVLDGVGWVFGIPAKIILWDLRVDNHDVSAETEEAIRRYLEDNDLDHVKVAINQYDPLDDWRRLRANTTMGWGYRSTLGVLSVAGEAMLPGRLFGSDHYNPFTGTIHLYSDVPAIALHEGGHAKDFARRRHPGTYALAAALPVVSLWPEAIATGDAIAYAERQADPELERESYRILYPAYGTYVGGSLGRFASPVTFPIYAGAVVAGHAVGRVEARLVPDAVPEASVAAAGIEPPADREGSRAKQRHAVGALVDSGNDSSNDDNNIGDGDNNNDNNGTGNSNDGVRLAWWPFGRR